MRHATVRSQLTPVTTPTRTWSVNRRYNDFVALDAELRASTGKEPPQPLPPKHWFKRTLHDEEVSRLPPCQ